MIIQHTLLVQQASLRTNDLINAAALVWPLCAGEGWQLPTPAELDTALSHFQPIIADHYASEKQARGGLTSYGEIW